MKIDIQKTHNLAKIPLYATDGSGAFDFYSVEPGQLCYGEPVIINTGLKVVLPEEYTLLIFSRSGHGFKDNVRLGNCVGVIDSDYRGEIKIKLTMDFPSWQQTMEINPGDRIAQGLVVYTPKVEFNIIRNLPESKRGDGGLGSTGIK